MTEQEAIQVFQELLDVPKEMLVRHEYALYEEQKEKINKIYLAEQMAIKALERQIPKKVVTEKGETFALTKDGKESYLFRYRCPSCNRIIRFFEANNFCMFCGQAIDWGEEE